MSSTAGVRLTIRSITEERRGDAPLFVHPEWRREYPWAVQGTTAREAGNFASFGSQTAEMLHRQWSSLRSTTELRTAVHGRQVHGAHVLRHGALAPGLLLASDSDGHITSEPGVLLAVSIADCVPVFVIEPERRIVAVLHAGWRGTAAGIVSKCIAQLGTNVRVHFGPAICGHCYEVGPEVHEALGLARPARNAPVDLRAVLAAQCTDMGIEPAAITTSTWCTRCGDTPFFSHRAGHAERQVGVIGIR